MSYLQKATLVIILLCLTCILTVACDPIKYTVHGTVFSYTTELNREVEKDNRISQTTIAILCPGLLRSTKETLSDYRGEYVLHGTGAVEDCELMFEHPNFNREIIKINKEYLKYGRYTLSPVYEVNVTLEPALKR